ncbi:MAG: hypothetical protein CVU42_17710 [Chloroflexi bacterium HGW-Chloroflexi-4]|jgi:hypothetical protein|nr:MAG: hypothetical protein CVU42_17710 [Chloroflexi bacterium HGW-Chloroflexi-4]
MSEKIGDMNSHCGECDLIDWCSEPYGSPYLCTDGRFEDVEVAKYITLAETSAVDLDTSKITPEINRDDFDCASDYEDAVDTAVLNVYKVLVADDVEKRLEEVPNDFV